MKFSENNLMQANYLLNEAFNLFESYIEFNQNFMLKFTELKKAKNKLADSFSACSLNEIESNILNQENMIAINSMFLSNKYNRSDTANQNNDLTLSSQITETTNKPMDENQSKINELSDEDATLFSEFKIEPIENQSTRLKLSDFEPQQERTNYKTCCDNNQNTSIQSSYPDLNDPNAKKSTSSPQNTSSITFVPSNTGLNKFSKKMFSCSYCGKSFLANSLLKIHERKHTGEKPYKCKSCSKTFSQKSSLDQHERTHTGEKPYECSECGKTFSQVSHLDQHERLHTGEKPYKCALCGQSFSQQSNLYLHESKHSGWT